MEQSNSSQVTETIYRVTMYVAGPYTYGNVEKNMERAIDVCNELIEIGVATFCPHMFYYFDKRCKRTYDEWLSLCFKWVSACDAFYRVEGYSPGSDKELALAFELEKPIFRSVSEVRKWLLP